MEQAPFLSAYFFGGAMKIRYEMTVRNPGTGEYAAPDDLIVREAITDDVGHAVEAFNEFIRAVWGAGWEVVLTLTERPDESDD
jgi:hypothetical protein